MKNTARKPAIGKRKLARMLRVDQAGEYGAKRIYAGQLAVLKRRGARQETIDKISEMAGQEEEHLAAFNKLVAEHQARPTALQPLWHAGGFALGAVTALLGEKAAMAATVAVEEVIDAHYARQSAELSGSPEIQKLIDGFRADEIHHKEEALAAGAEGAPGYPVLRRVVGGISRAAIWLAERV